MYLFLLNLPTKIGQPKPLKKDMNRFCLVLEPAEPTNFETGGL